ncbi:unnamed protein product [Haemonchus placei]|uniref:Phlebovirus glycoprotein G2 fusion domain-containing protein n=1 Tax=Haemonchus placei TaxID=6290 RepID=A0A0N4WVR1_HAEPC|nr:unnamed protein product [Haemonchus placei]
MAVITDLVKSRDGEIRNVMLQTSKGRVFQRTINRLIPLEIHSSIHSTQDRNNEFSAARTRATTSRKTSSLSRKTTGVPIRHQPPRSAKNQVSYKASSSSIGSIKSASYTLFMGVICILTLAGSASSTTVSCWSKDARLNTALSSRAEVYVNYKECVTILAEANITEVALPFKHLVNQHTI